MTSLMIFALSTKLTLIQNTCRILFLQGQAPRKFISKIFTEYFVVCPVELQGINKILICPILSPYFSGPWSWTSISVTMIMPSSPVTTSMTEFDFIVNENVDLLYSDGPWMDYQCHNETTSN